MDCEARSAASIALSVIIPFRNDPALPYIKERLADQLMSLPRAERIEFILVESAPSDADTTESRKLCQQSGTRFILHESQGEVLSTGELRDTGVVHARGQAVTFLDVDLRVAPDFWSRLLKLMEAYGISKRKKAFFSVPALYLTQEGTAEFLDADPELRFLDFYLKWLHGETGAIQNMASCSSVVVVDRLHYLSIGGHRSEFRGHGFEDFELHHRLLGEEATLPRPADYYQDARNWDGTTYRGFRAQFSLIGRAALMAGLFVVHLWHPRPSAASFYRSKNMVNNRAIWKDLFKEYDRTREHPDALIAAEASERTVLVLGKPRTNATRCFRDVLPILGTPKFVSEKDFVDENGEVLEDELLQSIRQLGIGLVLFNSPYGNPERQAVYEWCRRTGFPYLVFERGALPESWFLDTQGFNADSSSYGRHLWDRDLSSEQRQEIRSYIRGCLNGDAALEKQGARIGGKALASRLRIGGRKVLFVPLQRPSDTVIKHMAGAAGTFDDFLGMVDTAAEALRRSGWVVICKKHPLETTTPPLVHAEYAPDDAHFLDLIELADAVALINSGVGLYAMMAGKPCYVFGSAFYRFDGLTAGMDSLNVRDFCDRLKSAFTVDEEAVLRFVYYLRHAFYSFGIAETVERAEADGSLRTLTRSIDFYELQIPGRDRLVYERSASEQIPSSAPLFERYMHDLVQKKHGAAKGASIARQSTKPVPRTQENKGGQIRGLERKVAKLRRDPHRFFADSPHRSLRLARHLFGQSPTQA